MQKISGTEEIVEFIISGKLSESDCGIGYLLNSHKLKDIKSAAIFGSAKAAEQALSFAKLSGIKIICYIDDFRTGTKDNLPIVNRETFAESFQDSADAVLFGFMQAGKADEGIRTEKMVPMIPYTLSNVETNKNLYFSTEYVVSEGVPGDIAEFGTASGRTASVFAGCINLFSSDKKLHLFDSFEGFPEPEAAADKYCPMVTDGLWAKGGCQYLSRIELEWLMEAFLDRDSFRTCKGWFCDTLKEITPDQKFSLVHLDCDFYQSAFEVLDDMFANKRLESGAVVLFDDWNSNRSSRKFGERKAWAEISEKYSVTTLLEHAYSSHGYKFIIDTYK